MKDIFRFSKWRTALWVLGAVIALLVAFGFGVAVGSREFIFGMHFGENYYRNFFGPLPESSGTASVLLPGAPGFGAPPNVHGATGRVIDISTTSFSIADVDGDEFSVVVPEGAILRGMNTTTLGGLQVGDVVAVIGAPNDEGQISARFIRVLVIASTSGTTTLP